MQVCNSDRPASPSCYAVVGRLLFVQSQTSRLAQLTEQVFAGWQLTPESRPFDQPHVIIDCLVGDNVVSIPSGLERFELADQAQCYVTEGGLFVDFRNSLMQLSAGEQVSIKIAFKSEPTSIDLNFARTLSFAVCAGLRRHGIFELHSAGLLTPDSESGVMIVGPSGSGKSTLTTQLANAGWKYLSDDELLLTVEEDQVVARGFRRFFALSAEAVVSTGVSLDGTVSDSKKACFEPVDAFGKKPAERATPRYLFFTSLSRKVETHVIELSRTETMTRLLRACPWATYDREIAAENLKVLSKLTRQSRGFELVAGQDLLAPGYASDLLKSFIKA